MAKKKTTEYGGRWKPLNTLTESGQAVILLVEDKEGVFQDPCVLKRVLNRARHGRFRDEVTAIKTLSHPNVVKLLDHSAFDACACRKSNPDILVVQPAENWTAKNLPSPFDGTRERRILLQG